MSHVIQPVDPPVHDAVSCSRDPKNMQRGRKACVVCRRGGARSPNVPICFGSLPEQTTKAVTLAGSFSARNFLGLDISKFSLIAERAESHMGHAASGKL